MQHLITKANYGLRQLIWLPLAVLVGVLTAKGGLLTLAALILGLGAFFMVYAIWKSPVIGFFLALAGSFLVNGLTRYITGGPLGLSIDLLLVLSLLIAVFSREKPQTSRLNNLIFYVTLVWLGFTILELGNPEARSRVAWFYAVRAYSLYQFFVVLLVLLYLRRPEQLTWFTNLVMGLSVLATVWGLKQMFIGLDAAENAWLDSGPRKTHMLFGQLRVFSFYSDAGQYGAAMGHAGLLGVLLALGPFSKKTRLIYGIAGLFCFYGMLISGTRGALFVPAAGLFAYLIGTRNIRIFILGLLVAGAAYGFLKYTTIANDNYQVRRLRSALDPNDASLQVRLENQRKFKIYLATRPIGGGIGTSGSWGQRFSPGTFLAETPNDSWYVKVWAETGIVGLSLHIILLLIIIFKGFAVIFSLHDAQLKHRILCLHAAFIGIALASYGNPILGQFPTSIITYSTWAFLALAPYWDSPKAPLLPEKRINPFATDAQLNSTKKMPV